MANGKFQFKERGIWHHPLVPKLKKKDRFITTKRTAVYDSPEMYFLKYCFRCLDSSVRICSLSPCSATSINSGSSMSMPLMCPMMSLLIFTSSSSGTSMTKATVICLKYGSLNATFSFRHAHGKYRARHAFRSGMQERKAKLRKDLRRHLLPSASGPPE